MPIHKLFTPFKNLLFRGMLVALGWSPRFSHWLKGAIRKTLMLGSRPVPVRFRRRFEFNGEQLSLVDELKLERDAQFASLAMGDEFFVRYVPQSRYFQAQELNVKGQTIQPEALHTLNTKRGVKLERAWTGSGSADGRNLSEVWSKPAELPAGVYDVDYHIGRRRKWQLIYRLQRRTDEVEAALRRYGNGRFQTIVDVGTADGLMLEKLHQRFESLLFLGIDYNLALLQATSLNGIHKLQGDALTLPIKAGAADAVIATAVIEHVPDAAEMLRECARILRPEGLLVMTTPDPLMDRISSAIGLLKEVGHQETFNLRQLRVMSEANGFEVIESRKFMFSPIGFPGEKTIERILGPLGLSLVMANQLLVATRK